jgi:hypothetical protein
VRRGHVERREREQLNKDYICKVQQRSSNGHIAICLFFYEILQYDYISVNAVSIKTVPQLPELE